jgi:hypothetical protein
VQCHGANHMPPQQEQPTTAFAVVHFNSWVII